MIIVVRMVDSRRTVSPLCQTREVCFDLLRYTLGKRLLFSTPSAKGSRIRACIQTGARLKS